jgi:hypothetical protein
MRAKLSGNMQLHDELQAQAARLRSGGPSGTASGSASGSASSSGKDDTVVLAPLDSAGRLLTSLMRSSEPSLTSADERSKSRGLLRPKELLEAERTMSIADMARRDKEEGTMDEAYLANLLRQGRQAARVKVGASSRTGADEAEESLQSAQAQALFQSRRSQMTASRAAELDRQRAVAAHLAAERAESKCSLCVGAPLFQPQLVVAVGEHAYLALPRGPQVIAEGHARIVPLEPTPSMTSAPPALLLEVQRFKLALERTAGCTLVYMETVLDPAKPGAHTWIDCVPLDESAAELVPMFFKKALMEAGDEWAGAKNKVIDTATRPIEKAVPEGFAYFHVQWAGGGYQSGGYAHAIEDQASYKRDFGGDVLRGVLGADAVSFGRRLQREAPGEERQRVRAFKDAFVGLPPPQQP